MLAQVEERRQRLIRSFCAKAPVYENCRMLSHDGEPLSFIDYRKLAWYEVGPPGPASCDGFQARRSCIVRLFQTSSTTLSLR